MARTPSGDEVSQRLAAALRAHAAVPVGRPEGGSRLVPAWAVLVVALVVGMVAGMVAGIVSTV